MYKLYQLKAAKTIQLVVLIIYQNLPFSCQAQTSQTSPIHQLERKLCDLFQSQHSFLDAPGEQTNVPGEQTKPVHIRNEHLFGFTQ